MNISPVEIIAIILLIALGYYLFMCNPSEPFASVPFLGYESTPNFKMQSSFINFNRPDTTDWNLFMLNNRFRFQSIVPFFRFSNSPSVYPPDGLPTAPQTTPVLMVPGLGDCYMFADNNRVWPPSNKDSFDLLKSHDLDLTFDGDNSNMTPIIDSLKSLKYTSDTISIQAYDFRNIASHANLTELFKRIRQSIIRLYNYSNLPIMLIGQDIGCTLLSLFLSRQQESFVKEYIASTVFVGSVFGGTIQSARDYVAGVPEFGEFKYLPRDFDALKLKLPNKLVFEDEVVINYNNADYNGKQFHELLTDLNINPSKEIHELQKESLTPPICETIFINNRLINEQNKEIYDYWKPSSVHTINLESSKLFNNYDTILLILKKLNYSV
jgi:hypothetical protein